MDIVKIKQALETLEPLLNITDYEILRRQVGQGVILFHENKSEDNYRGDLMALGIDMKLDVDFGEPPF
jgi:hypothetical protein